MLSPPSCLCHCLGDVSVENDSALWADSLRWSTRASETYTSQKLNLPRQNAHCLNNIQYLNHLQNQHVTTDVTGLDWVSVDTSINASLNYTQIFREKNRTGSLYKPMVSSYHHNIWIWDTVGGFVFQSLITSSLEWMGRQRFWPMLTDCIIDGHSLCNILPVCFWIRVL